MNVESGSRPRIWLAVALLSVLLAVYVQWLPGEKPDDLPQTAVERGMQIAAQHGCLACHSVDGSAGIGPSWRGSYGSQRKFADGSASVVDENYLRRAMRQPQLEVVAGFDNLMLPVTLDEAQLSDVLALIRSLGTERGS